MLFYRSEEQNREKMVNNGLHPTLLRCALQLG